MHGGDRCEPAPRRTLRVAGCLEGVMQRVDRADVFPAVYAALLADALGV